MHATLHLVPAINQEEWDQFVHEHPQWTLAAKLGLG